MKALFGFFILLALVLLTAIPNARAVLTPSILPLTATLTNENKVVVLSWPQLPGNWQFEYKTTTAAEWKALRRSAYNAENGFVSVHMPIGKETMLYRVKKTFPVTRNKALPPMPAAPTNRPAGLTPQKP